VYLLQTLKPESLLLIAREPGLLFSLGTERLSVVCLIYIVKARREFGREALRNLGVSTWKQVTYVPTAAPRGESPHIEYGAHWAPVFANEENIFNTVVILYGIIQWCDLTHCRVYTLFLSDGKSVVFSVYMLSSSLLLFVPCDFFFSVTNLSHSGYMSFVYVYNCMTTSVSHWYQPYKFLGVILRRPVTVVS
jgi:hypothetical protein